MAILFAFHIFAFFAHLRYRNVVKQVREVQRRPANDRLSHRAGGFSLIELLIVVALMLILTTLFWSSGSAGRQQKLLTECQANLQKIHVALEIYANEHAGRFPEAANARTSGSVLAGLVPHYTVDTAVFICPGSRDGALPAGEPFPDRKISYSYYMGRRAANAQEILMSDAQVDTGPKLAGEFVFSSSGKPPGNNHGKHGGNFLFCDGHAEWYKAGTLTIDNWL